jgi:superfamily II DNA or RNA helicase
MAGKYELYEHQKVACRGAVDAIEKDGVKSVGVTAPTGFGKTIVASSLLDYFINIKGQKAFFLVNRIELVKQSMDKFECLQGKYSVIKSGEEFRHLYNPYMPCQLTMIQSWFRKREAYSFLKPDVILIDEFHDGWNTGRMKELINMYPDAKLIGLSATPIDDKGFLLKGVGKFIESITIKELQTQINPANGLPFLALDNHYIPVMHDYSHIKKKGNDYDQEELAKEVSQGYLIENIVELHQKQFRNKKTLGFCVNIGHAETLNREFKKAGYTSAVIHSNMIERKRKNVLQMHKDGKIDVLWNVGILTTGYDDPTLECIVLTYPTKSLRKYIQMVGRGGRVCQGKTSFDVLDFGQNAMEHGAWSEERTFYYNDNVRIKEFDPYPCPRCFNVIFEKAKLCPVCGQVLTLLREYIANEEKEILTTKADAMRLLEEQQYSNKLTIELLRELFAMKNDNRDVSLFFYSNLVSLKPSDWNEHFFNKQLQPLIRGAISTRQKPQAIVYKFREKISKIS